jgi:hypothetical protein
MPSTVSGALRTNTHTHTHTQTHTNTQTHTHWCTHVAKQSARKHLRPCLYTRRCVVADMPPAVRAEFKEVKDLEQQKRTNSKLSKDAVS